MRRLLAAILATAALLAAGSRLGAVEPGELAGPVTAETWYNAAADPELEISSAPVLLIDFWGVWCTPCVAALPKLERLRRKFAGRGLEIVAVHTPKKAESIPAFLADHPMTVTIAVDSRQAPGSSLNYGDTTQRYGVEAFPTYVLVGRDHRIRTISTSFPDDELIEALLETATARDE